MRILNDEEMKALPKIMLSGITTKPEVVAKAQYQYDLKEFIEWLNTQIEIHSRTDTNGVVWLRLGEMEDGVCKYMEYYQSLKQLVEEK